MEEPVKRLVSWKLIAILSGVLLTIAAVVIAVLIIGMLPGETPDSDSGPKFQKKYAGTDAANLRSVIAEAYINVMSDSNFVGPTSGVMRLLSLEAAGTTSTGYYSEVACKSYRGATLVVEIDSDNNVDAYFLTDAGKKLTLGYLTAAAEAYASKDEDYSHLDNDNSDNQVGSASAKAKAGTDAANLRSIIAEAYINVMSDSSFVGPTSGVMRLLSIEAAAGTAYRGYYSEVECKTDRTATLVVEIDSNNNVDAYFKQKNGTKLTLEYFTGIA